MLGSFQHSRDRVQVGTMFNVLGNGLGILLFNDQASAIAKGDVVVVGYDPDGTSGLAQGMQAHAPATSTTIYAYTAIALEAVAVDAVGYFQVSGVCQAFVDGTADVVAGDFLEVLNGTNELIKEGTTKATGSVGIALEAQAEDSNVLISIYKIGERHFIQAT